ncbi:AmmeMemoRadiSam system protein B [Candidatus Babeliales bacterium]|nr:AmmeMemoRadiSam system protein B [Candidatus Babeliales bacterium]
MKQFLNFFLLFLVCMMTDQIQSDVLQCHLSDRWYPSRGKALRREMTKLELQAKKRYKNNFDVKKIKAIFVPHAAFNSSGTLATAVYQNLKPKVFDKVMILAPSHHVQFQGVALPGIEYAAYKSPLSQIQIDRTILKKMTQISSLFDFNHHAHELEHSIEIQIPLIQKYCGFCKIIPLLIGDLNFSQVQQLADVINQCIDKKTLIIVSSDLTHYGTMFNYLPFDQNVLENIFKLDQLLLDAIFQIRPQNFAKIVQTSGDPVCGKNAILILLSMIQKKYLGDVQFVTVGYDTSSYVADVQNCVSYVGMIVTQEKK